MPIQEEHKLEITTKLDNLINTTKKLLNGPDFKLGEFSRKRSKSEFFVGYTAIQEAKDYNFFEHPYHKYSNFPKDSEKFYQRNFEDFVEMDCYEEDL